MLLQVGQLLSSAGTQSTSIAYALLTLGLTGSPAKAGLVGFMRLAPFAALALPAGVAADRFDRRRIMVAADAARGVALGLLAVALLTGRASLGTILAVALVEGAGTAFFFPASAGALRSVVPTRQLPAAAGAGQARQAAVRLAGPPLGGALFGIGRAVPFAVDALSVRRLARLRAAHADAVPGGARGSGGAPARAARGRPALCLGAALPTHRRAAARGDERHRPGILLTLVVVGRDQGLSGGEIGVPVAALRAAMLVGSLASPIVRRHLAPRRILLLELWTWVLSAAFVLRPDVYVLAAAILPSGFAMPNTDSAIIAYRLAITPDRLVGRVDSVQTTIAIAAAPLGTLGAGVMLEAVGARATIAALAGLALLLAAVGTVSPSIRAAPSLDDLKALKAPR